MPRDYSPQERRRSQSPDAPRRRDRSRDDEHASKRSESRSHRKERSDRDNEEEQPKEKPNFGTSGKLAAELNTVNGVELKYSEPPEARMPNKKYRLYVFKKDQQVDLFHINRQSAYLLGRDRTVVDIPTDHPSCSKQHAVLQYRLVSKVENGETKNVIRPYIIDLASSNGTMVNDDKIPPQRYYELQVGDVIKLGTSTRDYVFMTEEIVE